MWCRVNKKYIARESFVLVGGLLIVLSLSLFPVILLPVVFPSTFAEVQPCDMLGFPTTVRFEFSREGALDSWQDLFPIRVSTAAFRTPGVTDWRDSILHFIAFSQQHTPQLGGGDACNSAQPWISPSFACSVAEKRRNPNTSGLFCRPPKV